MSLTDTQKLILDKALKLIEKQGLASFKFSELALLANCSKTTLYESFKNKEDILCWVFKLNLEKIERFHSELLNMTHLSHRERLLCRYMFEVIRAWCCEDPALGVNFITANRYIWQHASADTIGYISKSFERFRLNKQAMWQTALDSGELQAEQDEIRDCHKTLVILQRGAVAVANNQILRHNGHHNDCQHIAAEMDQILNRLDWNETQSNCNIDRCLQFINEYLHIDGTLNGVVDLDPLRCEDLELSTKANI
ncbi:TetR/AcrR family transcriptional regulator [Shewanella youngdeokensis]|uniref:TetR/AcrR family transcriptional regulator n=1 Tax=Shewanella youngdeokensis TaxID=2999068 RepID=A0ABZ0K2Z1_9GAMM|nr:TetR/AcrR family transcriptional regulator [Shewanella sp. DAU334]